MRKYARVVVRMVSFLFSKMINLFANHAKVQLDVKFAKIQIPVSYV